MNGSDGNRIQKTLLSSTVLHSLDNIFDKKTGFCSKEESSGRMLKDLKDSNTLERTTEI